MCGIAGSFGLTKDKTWVSEEVNRLEHRGPDNQSVLEISSGLIMGSTRLAMTDPHPRSNQPFFINNYAQVIVFNGEIYNFRQLKEKLKNRGVDFQTESDTEVLAHWLDQFGVLGINEIQGMFSFAFYDTEKQNLLLARDSLGKKPLYWKIHEDKVYWSSSARNFPKSGVINRSSLASYLMLGYVIDPNSIFLGVHSLKPGEVLSFDRNLSRKTFDLSRFPRPIDLEQEIEISPSSLRNRLTEAVEARVSGHDKVALSLSGGVDSAIIAILLREIGQKTTCFSASWPDSDKVRYNDDANLAETISKQLGLPFQKTQIFSAAHLERKLHEYLLAMEEPNNNPTGLSLLSLYGDIAENGFKLLLTGDGSDEIFVGYPRHLKSLKFDALPKIIPAGISQRLLNISVENRKIRHTLLNGLSSGNNIDYWLYWHQVFSPKELGALSTKFSFDASVIEDFKRQLQQISKIEKDQPNTRSLMERDHQIWLSNESNRKLDRVSMGYSIEARSPFQDENVIDFAIVSSRESIYDMRNKNLLKEAFPELKTLRIQPEKTGFVSPLGHWLRNNPEFIFESCSELELRYGFNRHMIDDLKDSIYNGNYIKMMKMWTLLVLAKWLNMNSVEL